MHLHPKCISEMVRCMPDHADKPVRLSLCRTCPFRQGVSVYERRCWVTVNLIKVRLGLVQECHTGTHALCLGMASACTRPNLVTAYSQRLQLASPYGMPLPEPPTKPGVVAS